MLLERLGSRLEQSTYTWFLPSWSKSILTYIVTGALFLLLAVVGFAGCFGIRLSACVQLIDSMSKGFRQNVISETRSNLINLIG